jgi:phosphate starvation-inducible membrane PsiE
MRRKLQDKMFELSYLFELFISVIVGLGIIVFAVKLVVEFADLEYLKSSSASLVAVLDKAIILAIGAEFIKMLCKHTPETVIEVLAFALARQLIVGHTSPIENLITVIAIAILFAVRRFLLKRHDLVETPYGLVDNEEVTSENKIITEVKNEH